MLIIALPDNSGYAIAHHCYVVHTLPSLLGNIFFSHLQFVVAIPEFIYILWSSFLRVYVFSDKHT